MSTDSDEKSLSGTSGNWLVTIAMAGCVLTLLSMATLWAASKERVYSSEFEQWRGNSEPRIQLRYMNKFPEDMENLIYNRYVQNSCRSYSGAWSYLFKQLGSRHVRLIDSFNEINHDMKEKEEDGLPLFCQSAMIRCSVVAHFDGVSFVVVSPVRQPMLRYRQFTHVRPYRQYLPILIPTEAPQRAEQTIPQQEHQKEQQQKQQQPPLQQQQEQSRHPQSFIVKQEQQQLPQKQQEQEQRQQEQQLIEKRQQQQQPHQMEEQQQQQHPQQQAQSQKQRQPQQQQQQLRKRPTPKTLPHFCAHAPSKVPPSGKSPGSRFALFPARSSAFTEYFLGSVNNASDKLDISLSLEHLDVVYSEAGPSPKLTSILKGVVFPEADIPKEVVYHFYCLNIPVFLPAVDLKKIWQFGSHDQKSAVEHCNEDVTRNTSLKTNLDLFNALKWVKTYGCYYDLIEQIKAVESSAVRTNMWKENQGGYNDMTAFIQDLKKHSVNRKHHEGE